MFAITPEQNIILTHGDTARFDVVVKNPDGTIYTPVEGDTISFKVKEAAGLTAALISKTGASITIEHSDTASLDVGEYVYDVDITLAGGDINTIVPESKFVIVPEV